MHPSSRRIMCCCCCWTVLRLRSFVLWLRRRRGVWNTCRKTMTRETKYSEKTLALEQDNARHSSSRLQLTKDKGRSLGIFQKKKKKGSYLRNSKHQEKETLPLFEIMLMTHNNSVLTSQKTVPA